MLAQLLAQFEPTRTSMNTSVNQSTPQFRPFPDGYDLEAERAALADLLEAEQPDESDPRWPRVVEYGERLRQFEQMQTAWRLRKGADAVVADTEATVQAGGLIDEEPDAMVLHTKEAHRLFMGRARDPQGNLQPIVGGKRVAAALRSIWYLSGNDNPYADWALIDTGERIQNLKAALDELGRECEAASRGRSPEGTDLLRPEIPGAGLPGTGLPFPLRLHRGRPDRRVRLPRAAGQDPGAQGLDDRRRGPAVASGK
jgi:hypothetical protein